MTIEEVLKIKKFLEGNYPKLKETGDEVFTMMLSEYDFSIMVEAAKNYIKLNKFAPTIASLLEEYNKIIKHRKTEIVREMYKAGKFANVTEFEKSLMFVERDIIPDWFRNMMIEFIKNDNQLGNNKVKLLGL